MSNRERALGVLRYQTVDRLPLVHFGYWHETLKKWAMEGHITESMVSGHSDGNPIDYELNRLLGWDFNWQCMFSPNNSLKPGFERKVIKVLDDGSKHVQNHEGVVLLQAPGAGSIPAEISHLLEDRESWEEHYQHRYKWDEERITHSKVLVNDHHESFGDGGLAFLKKNERDYMYGLHCGSLFGKPRDIIGVEGISYMYCDDEDLYQEIIDTNANLCYNNIKYILETGAKFDFAHFWEDICFKNGPLVSPGVFEEIVAPHYKRITNLLNEYGIDIISLDCDGMIDALLPIWLEHGVNTMFPIEVGTWQASIGPWRENYGKELRGVGGMNKNVFAKGKSDVDEEIKRLTDLVALGGYIPCPDHRIPPDAEWNTVKYYCEKMKETFS